MLAATALLAVAATACGGTDADFADDPASSDDIGVLATDREETEDDVDDPTEHEGEDRDPAALFGVDVCVALLPALYGEVDGLDRYASPEVLAELSSGTEGTDPDLVDQAEVWGAEGICSIGIGDAWWDLELMGDGHVGENAVAISFHTPYGLGDEDPTEAADDPPGSGDVAAAATAYRDSGNACSDAEVEDTSVTGWPDHVVLETRSGIVVAIHCESFAYQSTSELMGWNGSELFPLRVEQWFTDGSVGEQPVVLGNLFVEDMWFAAIEKGRGVGDCGTYQQWDLDGDTLVLYTARYRECTDEGEPVGPDEWELVYTADV